MGFSKFISWVGSLLFSNSAQVSGVNDKELEHDDDQPGNKKRKTTHESMVIYDHEQGSSSASSSQPICHSDWLLSNDSSVCHKKWALKFKTNRLFSRALDVCKEVEHDEIQPKKMRRLEVQHWLTAVDKIRDEVQNIATDDQSIENFTSQVDELLQWGHFPHGYVLHDHSPIQLLLPSKNPAGKMFASNTATILEWLKTNESCIIGVYGMGGVGKTTMLRSIYNELLKQDTFGRPYWVSVSQNCDEHKLRNEIAQELGVILSGEGDDRKRAAILHERLSKMSPTVLFLDDMWKWNPFLGKDIEFPLKDSCCKIILSSRSSKVCQEMGCKDFTIKAKVLPEGEAWNLFVDKLGHYNTLTEEAKGIARSIAKECGGLPLAIATMARSMTEVVDVRVWNDALNELRQSSCEQSDMEEHVFSVLKYSYNRLNDQRLQNCFLSCILYPEDKKIKREEIIYEWIMEGLLDDAGSRSKQLNKGHTILNKLINSCLLEACTAYGSEGVKMHDLMRDLGIMITKGYPCFMTKSGLRLLEVPEEDQWSKDLVKVSLSWNDISEIPCGVAPLTPNLTLLKLNKNPLTVIPKSFFLHMPALTVLNLSRTNIQRLPDSVSDLENLRALLLDSCDELTYVPSLAKLSKLRVLDLKYDIKLAEAPKGIERSKCLEKVSYWPWDISDSPGFNKLIQSLPSSLSCYRFCLHDPKLFKTTYFYGCLKDWNHKNFWVDENIVFVAGAEIGDDKTTYLLPTTIEKLEILECNVNRRNLGDVFPTLGVAIDLRVLSVSSCKGLKYISSPSSLIAGDINLYDLPDLRGIIEFGGCSFSKLRRLVIEFCPKIKVIFPLMEKQLSLPNLEYFVVSNCEELEEIFESNSVLALPNLVYLYIGFLPKLRRLFMNLHLCTLLEKLCVWDCEELEEIFESSGSSSSSSTTSQSETETLVVDPMNACNPQPNLISALFRLQEISLGNLPKLGSIYKDLHLCTSLQQLEFMDCPKIEQIFGAPKFVLALPNLWRLKLLRLLNLSSIHRGLLLCTSLRYLNVEGCLKLKRVPLSHHLICDGSSSSLLSLPSKSDNPELWELLQRNYSEDARLLSDFIRDHAELQECNQNQLKLKRKWSDPDDNACAFTDYVNQVSLPPSLQTVGDDDEDEQNDQRKWGASLSLFLPLVSF
ncbi:probable disease resistance protein At4g27220 [Chenopodium quinoa]|uniref:probable disease resistance protein At4g27220 n=1 Tax=Chenopodium quinoa TaxID=63459 RepID=UPI000B779CE6|nr:probable disease resistance protein At4g27220 [Chenopodium quinoa]